MLLYLKNWLLILFIYVFCFKLIFSNFIQIVLHLSIQIATFT